MALAVRARGGEARRLRRVAAGAAGLAVGGLLVALVFLRPGWDGGPTFTPRFDLGRLPDRLRDGLGWLVPFAALAAVLPALRALVWREVLPAPAPRVADAYHSTALGALVHNVVPGKLGPLAAAFALSRMAARPFTPALASQLVARLLELGAVVALAVVAAAVRPSGPALQVVTVAGAAGFVALAAGAAAIGLGAPRLAGRLGGRYPRVGAALHAVHEGLAGAGGPARVGVGLALAALPATGAALAYGLPLRAAGVPESAAGGALVLAVIAFGQLTPGLPVGAGVHWTLASWAARELGASAEDAAALAILTHAGMVAAGVVVGAASAIARRGTFAEILRRRREVAAIGRAGDASGAQPRARPPT